jgi:hypothetical protein
VPASKDFFFDIFSKKTKNYLIRTKVGALCLEARLTRNKYLEKDTAKKSICSYIFSKKFHV